MVGDKQVLDVYLGKSQIANITLSQDQLYWSYHENWQKAGYGDEFEEDNINAYQLADFSDTCQLPRSLVAKRLKYLIGKLTAALQEEINLTLINDKEENYLKKYQEIVIKRCKHLLEQSDQITSMRL